MNRKQASVSCAKAHVHRQLHPDSIAGAPGSPYLVETARCAYCSCLFVDRQQRLIRPVRDSHVKTEFAGRIQFNGEMDFVIEGIVGGLGYGHLDATGHRRLDLARRISDGCQSVVRGRHVEAFDELWPCLMHVCCTAAKMRLQAEDIRSVAIVGPIAFRDGSQHLIDLLVVLMRPHIGSKGGWQCVVRCGFQPITEEWIAQDADQFLKRKHELRYGAKFGAAHR